MIPIIDLFAGPGGMGEGFSSYYSERTPQFDIRLSIEKDEIAHKTLLLRSFFRKFPKGEAPIDYYETLRIDNNNAREQAITALFEKYPKQAKAAKEEAWCAELGNEEYPSKIIDERIQKALQGEKYWVLIGGPPCQAYSMAGRSRVGGIDKDDHRVYLYKEYLRIIAVHHPSIFVMENVEGLLSAQINEEKIFKWILRDLRNPSSVFKSEKVSHYKIFSFTTRPECIDENNNPVYQEDRDFLIQAENFGIPQKRHRVILLGINENISTIPNILRSQQNKLILGDIIGDLPKIRSGLNRTYISTEFINGRKKRNYIKVTDNDDNWSQWVNSLRNEIISWNGFAGSFQERIIEVPISKTGAEYIKCRTPKKRNPLFNWYFDPLLKGVCNHKSRSHLTQDLIRYMFLTMFSEAFGRFPRLSEYRKHSSKLLPDHENAESGNFSDRFRVQLKNLPATTVTCHISKDGHYFIHYDTDQCRTLSVREAARIQTFPDNYLFCGPRTAQYQQVGNAVPPFLAYQLAEIVKSILI